MIVCSDFDEDCAKVNNPFKCWMGHPPYEEDKICFPEMPTADGYCPLVKQTKNIEDKEKV